MPEVEEYRIKMKAIEERLKQSSEDGGDEVQELKERLGTVRDSLRRKQEKIDNQKAEIASLREEGVQLSDMLGQALAALEGQSQGGIKEIVRSIDSEFADLLTEDEAQPEQESNGDASRRGPAHAEADAQEARSEDTSSEDVPPEDTKWEPEKESPPALQRIMGRRKR